MLKIKVTALAEEIDLDLEKDIEEVDGKDHRRDIGNEAEIETVIAIETEIVIDIMLIATEKGKEKGTDLVVEAIGIEKGRESIAIEKLRIAISRSSASARAT